VAGVLVVLGLAVVHDLFQLASTLSSAVVVGQVHLLRLLFLAWPSFPDLGCRGVVLDLRGCYYCC
jgi:hypothetical protein